jgi:GcrA cell cycle regulator
MAKRNSVWTEALEKRLGALWEEGLSASIIAERLGNGISRNAVISKRIRLGLPDRGSFPAGSPYRRRRAVSTRSTGGEKTAQEAKAARIAPRQTARSTEALPIENRVRSSATPEERAAHDVARKSLADVGPQDCRWPIGDPREADFGFCALRTVPGTSWCEHHLARVGQPKMTRAEREKHKIATIQAYKARGRDTKEYA